MVSGAPVDFELSDLSAVAQLILVIGAGLAMLVGVLVVAVIKTKKDAEQMRWSRGTGPTCIRSRFLNRTVSLPDDEDEPSGDSDSDDEFAPLSDRFVRTALVAPSWTNPEVAYTWATPEASDSNYMGANLELEAGVSPIDYDYGDSEVDEWPFVSAEYDQAPEEVKYTITLPRARVMLR